MAPFRATLGTGAGAISLGIHYVVFFFFIWKTQLKSPFKAFKKKIMI